MSIYFPQSPAEWLPIIVPLAAMLIGLAYFLAPTAMLRLIGLTGWQRHPHATGEARASFAGFPFGLGLSSILFGQPLLLMVLGVALALAAFGKAVHVIADGARMMLVLIRLVLVVVLAVVALFQTGFEPPQFVAPASGAGWAIAVVAAVTAAFGLVCLALPGQALRLLRLERAADRPAAHGEIRGLVAGFHLATGLSVLAYGGIFLHLALGICWAAAAFGRMIHMLSDGANDGYNWLMLVANLAMAAVPLAIVFGAI